MKITVKETYYSKFYLREKSHEFINLNPEEFSVINENKSRFIVNYFDPTLRAFLPESLSIEIKIIFAHFNPYVECFRNFLSLLFKANIKDSSFNLAKNEIVISKKSFDNIQNSLPQYMFNAGISKATVLDCILCHELGHAIHLNYAKKRGLLLPQLNDICIFINSIFSIHDENVQIYQIDSLRMAILENFADLYSMLLMYQLLDNKTFFLVLNATYEYRHNNMKGQGYISSYSLRDLEQRIKSKLNPMNMNFDSFYEVEQSIVTILCDNFKNIIQALIPSTIASDSLACGYFAEVLSLNISHVKDFEDALVARFSFLSDIKCRDQDNEKFLSGISIARRKMMI
ncbi:TPA: hypothetical protein ACTW8M_004969 [Klebsiella pneumoniae]